MSRDAQKRLAAQMAADLVEDGMVVGLGTGSTATFFIESLIARAQAGLRILCIPTSERSAEQARTGGLHLTDFATHPVIDLTIDGADEIKRDSLDLVKGLGGALLREKIVASASKRLVIIADDSKLVDFLGTKAPVPVEVTRFGWEATRARLRDTGADIAQRLAANGEPYITDGGNYILDAQFSAIEDGRKLNSALRDIVGVVETGLFIGMAELALVAGDEGVMRFTPGMTVLIVMGVSGVGKSSITEALNAHLHWPFQEGDDLHPASNVAKMKQGIPLTDADRIPWLDAVKAWIDARLAAGESGMVTCSALKRSYRDRLVAGRPLVRVLYLRADIAVLRAHLAARTGHFMPPSLLDSQIATLEEPTADEHPITVQVRGSVDDTVQAILTALQPILSAP